MRDFVVSMRRAVRRLAVKPEPARGALAAGMRWRAHWSALGGDRRAKTVSCRRRWRESTRNSREPCWHAGCSIGARRRWRGWDRPSLRKQPGRWRKRERTGGVGTREGLHRHGFAASFRAEEVAAVPGGGRRRRFPVLEAGGSSRRGAFCLGQPQRSSVVGVGPLGVCGEAGRPRPRPRRGAAVLHHREAGEPQSGRRPARRVPTTPSARRFRRRQAAPRAAPFAGAAHRSRARASSRVRPP